MPTKFETDRRRRIEDQRASHGNLTPAPTRSVLTESERLGASGPGSLWREPAPPRGAIFGLNPEQQTPYGPVTLPEGINTPYGPIGTPPPPTPNPGKAQEKANLDAVAAASVGAHAAGEDPRGQGANQPVPPPSASGPMPKIGTGPGADAATPPRADGRPAPGPGRTQVKMPDGRFVFVTTDRGADYVAGGGSYASYQDATSGLGAPQAERFMRGRTSRMTETPQDRFSSSPYSEQVRALASAPEASPETSLSFAGDTNFGTSGDRRLSGLEQALARRTWLEGRADTEQRQEAERAETDRRTRAAEQDPLELARIQAQGRMGGDVAKVELDLRARKAAVDEHQRMSAQIEKAQAGLAAAPPGSQDATDLKQYIDYLIQTRREIANLLLGERLTDPRGVGDALGAAFAGLGLAGGGAASTTGAR